jgi:signal transduction histidine kinase
MSSIIDRYKSKVKSNCIAELHSNSNSIEYWRDFLFAEIMIYLLPLSMIALIPSLINAVIKQIHLLILFDIFTITMLLYIVFAKGISVPFRKSVLIMSGYFVGVYLLILIGEKSAGLIYLYASTVFAILIFKGHKAYIWSGINVLICGLYALIIYFDLSPLDVVNNIKLLDWFATCVNLIFLSFLSSALVPKLFDGLSDTIEKQKMLESDLKCKQAELTRSLKSVEQKNKDLEQFAYVASHDLQEPLRMISSFLLKLEGKYNHLLDERGKQYIFFAVDGAKRMKQIIIDLLDYSSVGLNKHQIESINVEGQIKELMVLLAKQIEDKNATFILRDLPTVLAYKSSLQQVFQNLISNALKYSHTERDPVLEIVCEESKTHWKFSIKDNGIGINERHKDNIFLIFARLHSKEEYQGTGIGLAVVKKIVESFDGEIWVESEEGKGSVFYFTIGKNLE